MGSWAELIAANQVQHWAEWPRTGCPWLCHLVHFPAPVSAHLQDLDGLELSEWMESDSIKAWAAPFKLHSPSCQGENPTGREKDKERVSEGGRLGGKKFFFKGSKAWLRWNGWLTPFHRGMQSYTTLWYVLGVPEYLRRQCEQKQAFLPFSGSFFLPPPLTGHRMKQRLVSHEVSTFPRRQGWALGAL